MNKVVLQNNNLNIFIRFSVPENLVKQDLLEDIEDVLDCMEEIEEIVEKYKKFDNI